MHLSKNAKFSSTSFDVFYRLYCDNECRREDYELFASHLGRLMFWHRISKLRLKNFSLK